MKNLLKLFDIIALVAVIGLAMTACGGGGGGDENPYIPPVLPELTGTVSITGTAKVAETLTANITGLDGSGTVTYQWKRGATGIGTNSNTYVVTQADIDSTITVTVTRAGYSGSKTSAPTSTVVAADIPELTGTVTITGSAIIGRTLTASTSGLNGSGALTYQWKAGTGDVGTNSASYVVAETDIGLTITVTVTRAGYSGSKTSEPTAAVIRPFWTVVTNSTFGTTGTIRGVAWGNNKFVAVGITGSPITGHMAYSTDGKTWTAVTNSTFGNTIINSVVYGGSKWVAVGSGGRMESSSDGITWTAVTTSTFSGNITNIATSAQAWVAVGYDGRMAYSANGETWTAVVNSTFGAENINSVANTGGGRFVAVGAGGKIAYSEGGENWYAVTDSTFGITAINSVVYGRNGFVAVGNSGKMAYSSDSGVTWTAVENSPFGTTAIRSVTWSGISSGNRFVAVGNDGKTAYSSDGGVMWTVVTDGSFGSNDIYGTVWDNNGTGIAVGYGGRIAYTNSLIYGE